MDRLRGASLVDAAQAELVRRIERGDFVEGDRLVIDRLAKEFGTSLVPVREALARMHVQRILAFEPNKGYSVAPAPGEAEVGQLFDARLVIETGALELVLERLGEETLSHLTEVNARIRSRTFRPLLDDYRRFTALNADFHRTMIEATGNALVLEAYENLGYHQRIARTLSGGGVHDIELIVTEHDEIVEALATRDPERSRRALRTHIMDSRDRYIARHG